MTARVTTTRRPRNLHPITAELRIARIAADLTQQQLADRMGITVGMVSHYERGAAALPLDLAASWASCCGRALNLTEVRS